MVELFLQIILWIYHNLAFQNLGLAIIEIAVLSRLIFYPVTKQQTHYSKKMKELQPHIDKLKAKHKDNQQAMYQAQMELFKEHGVNPMSGCLPSVVQIGVLIGLLNAMSALLKMDINTQFFVWNMAQPDAIKMNGLPFMLPGILVITAAATQYIQMKMMTPTPPTIRKEDKKDEKQEKESFMESFAQSQASMMWMFPVMFLFLGTQWPSGLALYWSVSSILTIAQQKLQPSTSPIRKS